MPKLSELTDTYTPQEAASALPVEQPYLGVPADPDGIRRVVIDTTPKKPEPSLLDNFGMAGVDDKSGKSEHPLLQQLFGLGGEERYQLWPERMVREGITAAGDVMSGKVPQWAIDPATGDVHTSPQMIEKAQEMTALAGTGGLAGMSTDATLGATPFLRPALKYKDKLYKGKDGQQHLDVIPESVYPEFQQKAMSGQDINEFKFGFVNDKGHFLDREAALRYGIDTGLVDPQAGKFGALTSTLMADSSKPGIAIEAMKFSKNPNPVQLDNLLNRSTENSLRGMVDDSGMHVWDAGKLTHTDGAKELGLNYNHENRFHVTKDVNEPGYSVLDIGDEWLKNPNKVLGNSSLVRFLKNDKLLVDFPGHGKITGPEYLNMLKSDNEAGAAVQALKPAQPFFSAVEHNVITIPQAKMTGDQWLGTLSNKPGVKPEEMKWTGLQDFLEENKGKPVTKEQIQEHLQNNKVELKEVALADKSKLDPVTRYLSESFEAPHVKTAADIADARKFNSHFRENTKGMSDEEVFAAIKRSDEFRNVSDSKYHSYQLPGGENYREMLMTLPPKIDNLKVIKNKDGLFNIVNEKGEVQKLGSMQGNFGNENGALETLKAERKIGDSYRSSHWDEPNILAHVRMNDRTIDGKKSLHLEEIQSDWHQQGREHGYKEGAKSNENDELYRQLGGTKKTPVPDAPFKKSWHELALKRMIREAAEKGYDRLSWTPGEAQAARYDLSKTVDELVYYPHDKSLQGFKDGKEVIFHKGVAEDKLPDFVGKEAAKKLIENPTEKTPGQNGTQNHTLKGQDLKVGGEGMKGFYDQIIPKALEKLGKGHGVKVKQANLTDAPKYEMKNPMLNKDGKEIYSVYKDGVFMADMEKSEAKHYIETKQKSDKPATTHYIDIPQSLRDQAMHKGFPLFSAGGHMLVPVQGNPFENEKKK